MSLAEEGRVETEGTKKKLFLKDGFYANGWSTKERLIMEERRGCIAGISRSWSSKNLVEERGSGSSMLVSWIGGETEYMRAWMRVAE